MDAIDAPLVLLLESNDSIAEPLLALLRRTGYFVRKARTPVELFNILNKQYVALVLVDLSSILAAEDGRIFLFRLIRAHHTQRRQVLTFRYKESPNTLLNPAFSGPRALPNLDIYGIEDLPRLLEAVWLFFPLHGVAPHQTPRHKAADTPLATVFISYSHADQEAAQRAMQDLEAMGVAVWVDHERLAPGTSDWERAIRRAITSATGVIYMASEEAAASPYVRDELAIARDNNITVFPLWIRGATWSSCAPLGWGTAQRVDARGDKYASAIGDIIAQVTKANGGT